MLSADPSSAFISVIKRTETYSHIWWLQQCHLLNENVTDTFVLEIHVEIWGLENKFNHHLGLGQGNQLISLLRTFLAQASCLQYLLRPRQIWRVGHSPSRPASVIWKAPPVFNSLYNDASKHKAKLLSWGGLKGENNDGSATGCGGQSTGLGIGRSANKQLCDLGKNLSSFSLLFFPKRKEFILCFIRLLPTLPFYGCFQWI